MRQLKLKNWWKNAFENEIYPLKRLAEDPVWRKKTSEDIAFLHQIFHLKKSSKVLDVGCGVGRHSVELAKLGYEVTGLDISAPYLAEASRYAKKLGLHVRFVRQDMRRAAFNGEFDAAINLFTSFGYFLNPTDDLKVLKVIGKALKPGGFFLLDVVNGTRIAHLLTLAARAGIRSKNWDQLPDGTFYLEDPEFLPKEKGVRTRWIFLSGTSRREMVSFTRTFPKNDLLRLFRNAGLRPLHVYGDMKGSRYISLKSPRLVVLARKAA